MGIEAILKQEEGKTLEFKENLNSNTGIIATIIAFSNTAGGKLVIGVSDKGHKVVGVQNPHRVEESIASMISDSITPSILPNIEIIPYRDTHVIVIEIYPGANRPYYLKSKGVALSTYIRVGSTNRLSDPAVINSLKRSLHIKTFDEESMCEATCEDIDFTLISKSFKHRVIKKADCYSLGLLNKEQNRAFPSVGCMLLFGKNRLQYFPEAWIQAGRFKGENKAYIIDQQEIKTGLLQAVDEAAGFIQKHLLSSIVIENLRSRKVWSIPEGAIREAVINAIVHTDYSLVGAPIRISIFDDRIEIENPSVLLDLTIDDIMSGISRLRNRIIARVFHELHLIEQWGTGVHKIITLCENAGLRTPKFQEIGNRFRVTLYKEHLKVPEPTPGETKIVEAIKSHGSMSTKDIAACVGLTSRIVRKRLINMIEKNLIVEVGRGSNDPKKKYDIR